MTGADGPLHVALVCPYDLALPGGVQQQVTGLAGALRRLGHDAAVLGPGRRAGAITVGCAFRFRVNGSVAAMAPHPAAAARTVRALRRGGFDVVHLHEPLAPSITMAALIDRPAPIVGTFHAAGERTPYRWAAPPLRRLAVRIDIRTAVSADAARLAQRHLGGEYEVIANGIDVAVFTPPPDQRRDRSVLYVGRHEPRKGLEVLLAAARLLPDDVTVRVAGAPATTAARRAGAGCRIEWLGELSEADKVDHLRRAGVVCVPSLSGESFGVVLLEAMAAGAPVVASDLPAYRAVSAGSAGGSAALLVAPGDAAALADALRRVLDDDGLARRLRDRGAATARRSSIDDVAERYVALYRTLRRAAATRSGTFRA